MTALFFLVGVVAVHQLQSLSALWFGMLIIPILFVGTTGRVRVLVTSLTLGWLLALFQAYWHMDQRLPEHLERKSVMVSGQVESIPVVVGEKARFNFVTESLRYGDEHQSVRLRVRLSWFAPQQAVLAGQRWAFQVKLKRPRGFANPAGFDYETWLYRSGIGATGYVVDSSHARCLDDVPQRTLNHYRQTLLERLSRALDEKSIASALVPALSLGVRQHLDQQMWDVFRATGTGHLMAISGLHVGIIAAMFYGAGFHLWRQCVSCTQRLSAVRAAALAALAGAFLYSALAGFSIPTQRAMLMLAVVMFALLAGRKIALTKLLSAALIMVLVMDTRAVLSPGFWLSFSAVAVIFLIAQRDSDLSRWRMLLYLQLALSLVFVPLTGWFFGEASLISPLANLVAVPVMTLLVVPLALLVTVLAAISNWNLSVLVWVLDQTLDWLFLYLDTLAGLPWSKVELPQFLLWQLLACVGLFILFLKLKSPRRYGLLLLVALVLFGPWREKVPVGGMSVAFLDVGQGLSVVVRTHDHALVYDLGPRFSDNFNAAEAVVLPYLRQQGVDSVDRLVISHEDLDHRGALNAFLDRVPVEQVLSSQGVPVTPLSAACVAGEYWQWDGVSFEILHPPPGWQAEDNDQSCVLKVTAANGFSLLLTGDITDAVEKRLVTSHPDLNVTVLQVPHHGSRTSSSSGFLEATRPTLAVATMGYGNRWGFPKPDVVQRYVDNDTKFLRTDRSGAVIIDVPQSGDAYQVTLWRDKRRSFWKPEKITD